MVLGAICHLSAHCPSSGDAHQYLTVVFEWNSKTSTVRRGGQPLMISASIETFLGTRCFIVVADLARQ